jgi:hypothetical protein
MYLIMSRSTGLFFVWTGPETRPSLEHGLLAAHLDACDHQGHPAHLANKASPQDIILGCATSVAKPRAFFTYVSMAGAQVLGSMILGGLHGLKTLKPHTNTMLRLATWITVIAIMAASGSLFSHENPAVTPNTTAATEQVFSGSPQLLTSIGLAFGQSNARSALASIENGIVKLDTLHLPEDPHQRIAIIPGHLVIPSTLAVVIETTHPALYARLSDGQWAKRLPFRMCPDGHNRLFALEHQDLFALMVDHASPPPKDVHITAVTRSISRHGRCVQEIEGEP